MAQNDAIDTQRTPRRSLPPAWFGYAVAVLLQALVTAAIMALDPYLPLSHYPIVYVIAIMAVAYWYGEGPGVFAFLIGLLAVDYFTVEPLFTAWPIVLTREGWARIAAFLLGGLAGWIMMIALRRSRHRIEVIAEELRASEERFRSLVETTSDWIWEVDARGVYTYASPRVKNLLGYEPSEVVGKRPFDLMPPEEAEQLAPVVRGHFERGEPIPGLENLCLHKNGYTVLLETSGLPVFDERGVLAGYRGIDRDITERKQAEEALRESESKQRRLTESLPQLVWTCLPEGPCDYLSRQWIDYTGIPEAEQLGYGWLQQLHPDDREPVMAQWSEAVKSGTFFDIEFRIRHKDGEYRWFQTRAVPIRDARGELLKWYGSNTDIQDLRTAMDEVNRLKEALEHRVIERTAQLNDTVRNLENEVAERKRAEEKITRQLQELQRWYEVTLNREGRVLQLKQEVNELLALLGEPARYASQESEVNTPTAKRGGTRRGA